MSDPLSLLPLNATQTERNLELVTARMAELPVPIRALWNPQTCAAESLPYLAWALSVDNWESAWSVAAKRGVIAQSVAVHRVKGTRGSVERALKSLGFGVVLTEWFEYGGPPHTFKLDAFANEVFEAGFMFGPDLHTLVTGIVETVKPVRAHFDLRIGETYSTPTYLRTKSRAVVRSEMDHTPQPRGHSAAATGYLRTEIRAISISHEFHDCLRSAA